MATSHLLIIGFACVAAHQVLALTGSCATTSITRCDDTCAAVGNCLPDSSWAYSFNCPAGQVCFDNDTSAECGPSNGTVCSGAAATVSNVSCLSTGFFPDLTDCRRYYNCSTIRGSGTTTPCPQGQYFNSVSRSCAAGSCTSVSTVVCTGLASKGVDPNNNGLFYFCARGNTTQFWSACPSGQQFSVVDNQCYSLPGAAACNSTGAIPYSTNACQYIWCAGRGNFGLRSCTSGFHFDTSSRRCIRGGC